MKNVLGQFEDNSGHVSDLEDVRTWGLMKAFRTIKPGGHIVVAEEITPWESNYLEGYLKDNGFEPIAYEHISDTFDPAMPNQKWQQLRRNFYGPAQRPSGQEYI